MSNKSKDQLIMESVELLTEAKFDLEHMHFADAKDSAHDAYINLIKLSQMR